MPVIWESRTAVEFVRVFVYAFVCDSRSSYLLCTPQTVAGASIGSRSTAERHAGKARVCKLTTGIFRGSSYCDDSLNQVHVSNVLRKYLCSISSKPQVFFDCRHILEFTPPRTTKMLSRLVRDLCLMNSSTYRYFIKMAWKL